MSWQSYTLSLLAWNGAGVLAARALAQLHAYFPRVPASGAWVQSFISATTALALLIALLRNLRIGKEAKESAAHNFWKDLLHGTLYILLPLALLLALALTAVRSAQAPAAWTGP